MLLHTSCLIQINVHNNISIRTFNRLVFTLSGWNHIFTQLWMELPWVHTINKMHTRHHSIFKSCQKPYISNIYESMYRLIVDVIAGRLKFSSQCYMVNCQLHTTKNHSLLVDAHPFIHTIQFFLLCAFKIASSPFVNT